VQRLLGQPGRELRVFDPDGAALRLNDSSRVGALERFSPRAARDGSTLCCTTPTT